MIVLFLLSLIAFSFFHSSEVNVSFLLGNTGTKDGGGGISGVCGGDGKSSMAISAPVRLY
jgi:hypothetical protein